ncbi:hypothetical protein HYH03_010611 [Edaphochlamys debaryana]|uniref:Ankyrin repeat domain-containing protein n=1 Tax=Edaphochlamys debaryana TaxID=47281 RepID=A0A835XW68_9CHLO|nr:hypothetical protein HYH03_010611 [Edaphochlamys debaryana]|eukprot:KAG2490934.1 hypothetical protein HYH03_010611 [Edaphochlamys debaryana]
MAMHRASTAIWIPDLIEKSGHVELTETLEVLLTGDEEERRSYRLELLPGLLGTASLATVQRLCGEACWGIGPLSEGDAHWSLEVVLSGNHQDAKAWRDSADWLLGVLGTHGISLPHTHPCGPETWFECVFGTEEWRSKADWLVSKGCRPQQKDYKHTTTRSGADRLIWLKEQGVIPYYGGFKEAIERGNTSAFTWLLEQGCSLPAYPRLHMSASLAAAAGHLGVLRLLSLAGWAASRDAAWNKLFISAAAAGRLDVMAWARSQGAGPGRDLATVAFTDVTKRGVVEAMRWLHDVVGCDMDKEAWKAAARSGCEAAVELLAELGCPKPADGTPYTKAIKLQDNMMIQALQRAGVAQV